jgi:cobalamin biosynthesis protein CobT
MAKSTTDMQGAGGSKKSAPAKIKVSQDTINGIKKMGMTASLKLAGLNAKADQGGLASEFNEGVRRMYGDRRYQDATRNSNPVVTAPKYTSPDAARSAQAKPVAKSPDAARAAAVKRAVGVSAKGGTASQALKALKKK